MAIRSGLAAQLGMVAESTVGTYATPTRFLEFTEESLRLESQRIESKGLRANNRVLRSDRWASNKKGAGGDVGFEVASKGFGLLFKHSLGSVVISTPGGGTNSRDHTCTIGDDYGLGLTVQVGRPDVAGTVQPFSYLGCKVTEFELSNEFDGLLMFKPTLDAMDETTAQSLASASYPSGQELLHYGGGSITLAGSAFDVKSISVKVSKGLDTERYFIRGSTLKKEAIPADLVVIEGEMEAEFESLTAYNRFVNGTTAAIVALWEGSTIESTLKYGVQVTLPVVRFDGDTPVVSGPEVLAQPLKFKALYDGSQEPITLRYRTTDTTS